MARSTKESDPRIWVAARHLVNRTLFVQGFSDTLVSENNIDWFSSFSAESKTNDFLKSNKYSMIIDGAKTAEDALRLAKEKGI